MVLGSYNRQLDSSCPGCFDSLPEFQNVSHANYNALEASLTRQPKSSPLGTAYFTFAYTYAHNLDNASGFAQRNFSVPAYSPDFYYASGDSDVRHRISFQRRMGFAFRSHVGHRAEAPYPGLESLSHSSPGEPDSRLILALSCPLAATPLNPGSSGAGDPALSNAAVVAPIRMFDPRHRRTINEISYGTDPTGTMCVITTTPVTGNFIFDPNSFSNIPLQNTPYFGGTNPCFPQIDPVNNPGDRTYGLPRNVLRGPGLTNLDIALAKTTSITERVKLEFRVEYFNALNHPEFAQPTSGNGTANLNSPTFGQITTTGNFKAAAPRIGQLAMRLTF